VQRVLENKENSKSRTRKMKNPTLHAKQNCFWEHLLLV